MKKTISSDRKYMDLALELALQGYGRVSPNPMVGCVIVNDGAVVGTGYHEYFGGPHAEVNALTSAGERARGATMFVTLEPCNHWGKTPPCADAILSAGIRRVVAAMPDPNPRIAGNGLKRLRENRVVVTVGVRQAAARRLNRDYIRHFARKRVPRVTLKAAMSLDGKIATRTGDSKWITGTAARDQVHRLRTAFDGILVGIHTVLKDDPALTSHGKGKNPVRVIIDPGLKIPLKSQVLDIEAPKIIIHAAQKSAPKLNLLRKKGAVLIAMHSVKGRIDFKEIVRRLIELDIYRILIEGGGETAAAALEAGVVKDVCYFLAPKIIGGRNAVTPVEGSGIVFVDHCIRIRNMKCTQVGQDIMITGTVR
jgi:diaminohydroxyphosphoribosylaminopyrimidine deaminase/5-amino-6-(5-phosphoribosylamino)uracil reductase